jgi:hypothetical protein
MLLLIGLHAIHHPVRMVFRKLLFAFLGPHLLLHLKPGGHIDASLNRRTLLNGLQPLLQFGERLGLDTWPFCPVHPGETAEIRDGILAANKPETFASTFLRGQAVVEDLVEPLCFCLVASDGVIDLFRSISVEVVC